MKTKRIILTIATLVTAVITFVGSVFALNFFYGIDNDSSLLVSFGKPITVAINGDRTNAGNYDTEVQPGSYVTTPEYTIDIAHLQDPNDRYDYQGGASSNVALKYVFNVYLVIREDGVNPNTADTKHWYLSCRTGYVTDPNSIGYVEGKTKPYGDNQHTAQRQLPLRKDEPDQEGKYYDKVLLVSNVGLGDTFSLEFYFSNSPYPDPVESKRTLAFDLVLSVEVVEYAPAEVEYLDIT